MFLGPQKLREALSDRRIVVEDSFASALKGMTIDVRLGKSILVPKLSTPLRLFESEDQIEWEKIDLLPAIKANSGKGYVLKQNTLILGHTEEKISLDKMFMAFINSRSTAARIGLIPHHAAPLINPGHGTLADGVKNPRSITLEISTSLPCGIELLSGMIIAQLKFAITTDSLDQPYDARPGASYGTDHGQMIPKWSSLLPSVKAVEGDLAVILGLTGHSTKS